MATEFQLSQTAVAPKSSQSNTSRSEQFVGFTLHDAFYAIPILKVHEVILPCPVTRLPHVAEEVDGLINLRGNVLPVINLRTRFRLPSQDADDQTRIVIVDLGEKRVGMLVDAVTQVMKIPSTELQTAPPGIDSVTEGAIASLFHHEGQLTIVLDVDRLLSDLTERRVIIDQGKSVPQQTSTAIE